MAGIVQKIHATLFFGSVFETFSDTVVDTLSSLIFLDTKLKACNKMGSGFECCLGCWHHSSQ